MKLFRVFIKPYCTGHAMYHRKQGEMWTDKPGRRYKKRRAVFDSFRRRALRIAPALLTLVQQALDQRPIGIGRVTMAAPGIPVPALFAVAPRMGQAKVEQVIAATQTARLDMLNICPKAGFGIKAQPAATDQAFARPEAIGVAEGSIGLGNMIFLRGRHRLRRAPVSLGCVEHSVDRWSVGCDFPGSLQDMPDTTHQR